MITIIRKHTFEEYHVVVTTTYYVFGLPVLKVKVKDIH